MTVFVAANNAISFIVAGLAPSDTTIQLSAGTGSLFPVPANGAVFAATLTNATGTVNEIVYCTGVTGDLLTVERAQEGTVALSWPARSVIQNFITEGTFNAIAQWDELAPFATVDLGSSGTATIDISAYNYKAARVTIVAQAEAPTVLTNITGAWPGAEVTLIIAEGSDDISIPVNTAPFFIANNSGPNGWPGTPMNSITFMYVPANTSYKWIETGRNWRIS